MHDTLKLGIICGSQRLESQSARVGQYIAAKISQKKIQTYFLELAATQIPFWNDSQAAQGTWGSEWIAVSQSLQQCDGFVVVSPEWGGMVPPILKNFFLLCSQQEISHKPALIVSVSAGRGGSYPVQELRSSSYKNTKICYIPDHVIIRGVNEYLHTPDPASKEDAEVRQRIDYSLDILVSYSNALQLVRRSEAVVKNPFPNGM